MKHLTHIEPLEDRIAPATILNPYTVTYQDGSGGTAIVKISKPLFKNATAAGKILLFTDNSGNFITERFTGNGTAENLTEINLLARTDAAGMNISVKVIPQVGVGNATVNVGEIAAANFSLGNGQVTQNIGLGSVYIEGNLGFITAGIDFVGKGTNSYTPAIKSLTALSMDLPDQSSVLGPIGSMNVKGNFNANLQVIGYQFGNIGKLNIGGSLAGDSAGDAGSGEIQVTGQIGSATIGNITGSSVTPTATSPSNLNENTGELVALSAFPSRIDSLHVLGSITGGAGLDSGRVFAQSSIGKVTVGGSVKGGAGQDSGEIAGPLGTVKIGGSLTGGSGISSGTIRGEIINTASNPVPVAIGSVTIGGDVRGGTAGVAASSTVSATPGDSGIISASSAKSITIAGSLMGGTAGTSTNSNGILDQTADTSGDILVYSVKNLTIGRSITGGSGPNSGLVTGPGISVSGGSNLLATMKYGSIVVHGDVAGGAGAISGSILVNGLLGGSIASVQIGEGLTGSSGTQSGEVYASTGMGTLYVGGDVTGGTANNTGKIFSGGNLSNGTIKGNITGSSTSSTTALIDTGYVQANGISTLTVGGALTAGTPGTAGLGTSGAIRSGTTIGNITVGSLVGNATNPAVISAVGQAKVAKNATTDVAIQNVTVTGAATYGDILAGYNTNTLNGTSPLGTGVNANAQIGTVTIGGNLTATNIIAGVAPDTAGFFGTSGSKALSGSGVTDLPSIISTISNVIIKGNVVAPTTSTTDTYGIAARYIVNASVDGTALTLDPGPFNDTFANGKEHTLPNASGNVVLYEVGK